jgi:hypothetical protein
MPRATNFPTPNMMDGINSDRKEIIEIIKQISTSSDNRYKSIPQILLKLSYPGLPTDSNSIDNSKQIISRLIHCEENNKYGDSIGKLEYSDLLKKFKEKFPDYPKKIVYNFNEISDKHDDYYIYYYESYSEMTEEYYIKFALMGFDKGKKTKEWEKGVLYYLNDDFAIHKQFMINRVMPPKTNNEVLFFSAKFEDQVNFFTLQINRRSIESRGIIPLTYSVLETQMRYPCAGKALLEKIPDNKYIPRIEDIKKRGISEEIINSLYQRKFVLDEKIVYNKATEFTTSQMSSLDEVKGIWSGVHLRTDFEETYSIPEKGGICKFILKIDGSGECQMFWGKDKSGFKKYSGFVEFPFNSSTFMKVYLEFLKKEKTYKLYIFLSLGAKSGTEYSYKGVISGWMNDSKKIYTSPVYIKQIYELDVNTPSIEEVLRQEAPKRISKTLISEIAKIDSAYITALKIIEGEHMAMFSNCMPQ